MALTFIHTGDLHVDTDQHSTINPQTGINTLWESNLECVTFMVDTAVERAVDFVLLDGDNFKNGRPSQEAILLLTDALLPLTAARIPIIMVEGNHERLSVLPSHRTSTDTVAAILRATGGEVHTIERTPELIRLDCGIQIAGVPWLSKSTILSQLGETNLDPVEGDRKVIQYALQHLDVMATEIDPTAPTLFATHATVDDLRLDKLIPGHHRGSEVDLVHIFNEPVFPRKLLSPFPSPYKALSHIHARQTLGDDFFYAGSLNRFTFTDAADDKSFTIVTISDDNKLERTEYIKTPARVLRDIHLDRGDALDRLNAGDLLRVYLPEGETRLPDNVLTAISDAGAKLIETKVRPAKRERSTRDGLSEGVGIQDAVRAYFTDRKTDLSIDQLVDATHQLMHEEN